MIFDPAEMLARDDSDEITARVEAGAAAARRIRRGTGRW